MSERVNVPFTNEHFAAFCLAMEGQPYWYGATLNRCTQELLSRKGKQYPSHYAAGRQSRYRQDIAQKRVCADCVGGCKGYAWTNGGQGVRESLGTGKSYASRYGANGCPDKGANGMFAYAKAKGMAWGGMDTLPDILGLALHKDGHMGYTVGGGWAIEWKSFADGCVKSRIAGRGWTAWFQLPFIQYGSIALPAGGSAVLGSRPLRSGQRGEDVKALQSLLMKLGFSLPRYGADGSFGQETETALRAFQKSAGLTPSGAYDAAAHEALMAALADSERGDPAPAPSPASGKQLEILSPSGLVNIRRGNETRYGRITQAAPGARFPYVATAENGWHALALGEQVGWVSGEFSRLLF